MADLATVDDVGAVLGQTLDPTDPAVTFALAYASALIRSYLDQQLDLVTGDVEVGTPLSGTMFLRQFPVLAVTQVETLDLQTNVWTVKDPSTYRVSLRLGTVHPTSRFWPSGWPCDEETWRVTYNHGYATIPADIVGVCASIAARQVTMPVGIESERVGQRATTYSKGATENAFSALEMLVLTGYAEGHIQ